jgi:hypothetical protein
MNCKWNEMMNGEKFIEHIIPNPWNFFESIKHRLHQSLNWVVLINKNWLVVPKNFPCQFHNIRMSCKCHNWIITCNNGMDGFAIVDPF